MKLLLLFTAACTASLLFGACQNSEARHPDDFGRKTHRVYNPETGGFEQSPPWGKESNKAGDEQ